MWAEAGPFEPSEPSFVRHLSMSFPIVVHRCSLGTWPACLVTRIIDRKSHIYSPLGHPYTFLPGSSNEPGWISTCSERQGRRAVYSCAAADSGLIAPHSGRESGGCHRRQRDSREHDGPPNSTGSLGAPVTAATCALRSRGVGESPSTHKADRGHNQTITKRRHVTDAARSGASAVRMRIRAASARNA
jgi:hypothetical protein